MPAFVRANMEAVSNLAERLDLPQWLVDALILEYLPCRHFFEGDAGVVLDYAAVDAAAIEHIPLPYVILSNVTLYHNVQLDTAHLRMANIWASDAPMVAIGGSPEIIPEGKVSPSRIPEELSGTDRDDNLLAFGPLAVVWTRDGCYQWRITDEPVESVTPSNLAVSSEIISTDQLERHRGIRDTIFDIVAPNITRGLEERPPYPSEESARDELRKQLGAQYAELQKLRIDMRQQVLAYHAQRKVLDDAEAGYSEDTPPILTLFDQIRVTDGHIQVRTHVEPLFYRSAFRAAARAKSAKNTPKGQRALPLSVAEEIEAAAECIALCAMCLEAFINGVFQDRLPSLADALIRSLSAETKWWILPELLGKDQCFHKGDGPYQGLARLFRWRNNELMHYKHEFKAPDKPQVHGSSMPPMSNFHLTCNAANAEQALSTVRAMVSTLCACLDMGIPQWVTNGGAWLDPAD